MIGLLIWFLIVLLVMYTTHYLLNLIAMPEPVKTIILFVFLILLLVQRYGTQVRL